MKRVAINGLGRIGRAALKIIISRPEFELVAVNDLVPTDNLAYLLQYDTVYGRYEKEVSYEEDDLCIDGKEHKVLHMKDPAQLPWKDLDVDIVFECTGVFGKKEELEKHVKAGAKKVILSAPSKSEEVLTIVHGVNVQEGEDNIISCASCTTNCITPVVEVMSRRIGIKKAVMTTIHAYTSTQAIVDSPASKWRRGRAAACNLVPTSTGAAKATIKVLPQYEGKFDGVAVRAPVPVGSVADLVFVTERETTEEEVNSIFIEESQTQRYKGVLGVAKIPVVSSDIIKDPRASIFDPDMTRVIDGDLVKVMSWYDNEWGYANQMVNEALKGK
ncbi:MAG: type I glyceraldehyde-3-phosphate dehydrogenase [Candidatus Omnitrophica bacterium]|nr:type I glyceraldehyde-3-phosphate dehydrogenase [Candidatus Omnitrophota bacterium]